MYSTTHSLMYNVPFVFSKIVLYGRQLIVFIANFEGSEI